MEEHGLVKTEAYLIGQCSAMVIEHAVNPPETFTPAAYINVD